MRRDQILELIQTERERQDKLHPHWFGDQHGLVVLAEEFGEVAKALYERDNEIMGLSLYPKEEDTRRIETCERQLEDEIIQVAAVCFRWLENRR